MDLEEQTIEHLPERCQNCGTPLTEAEKVAVMESGATLVLCTTCASEQVPVEEEAGEEAEL
jgi:RNase P subunit RPR2